MSVIVKGMEMPNACCHCPCSDSAGCAVTGRAMTTEEMAGQLGDIDNCPLRPLPKKHGRLIDGDALHALYESRWHDLQVLNWDENPHAEDIQTGVNWCINTLHDDLPTIVEAEGDDG